MASFKVIRAEHKTDCTKIPVSIIQNKELSYEAKAILILILSFPENWNFSIDLLTQYTLEDEVVVSKAILELEAAGYIERRFIKDENGLFRSVEYDIYEDGK